MQQQQPGMPAPSFSPTAGAGTTSPISNRPAAEEPSAAGSTLPAAGGSAGNRWPRQETLALLKIRSEMDAAFREAALKGPLWEQVSRKLAAMGYKRSAKKCREKFENVDKYYKRTKDGRAGRGDGKAYRFFSELEALRGASHPVSSLAATPVAIMAPPPAAGTTTTAPMVAAGDVVSFSSCSDGGKRKRRRDGNGEGSGSNMMRFFEGLMRQVTERQEEMQQRFIEAIERREQERVVREEAWRRQEVARLAREQDALERERAVAASRDAAVVSFIQSVTGQTTPMPPPTSPPPPPPFVNLKPPSSAVHDLQALQPATPKPMLSSGLQPQQQQEHTPPPQQLGGAPSRWPKAEVHALIRMRTELEDAAPKGPLWEDVSAGMRRLGYDRSSKRCKEKWENINKYFKKVKESNKKRPDDSKTCPYYHQLDALYRSKERKSLAAPPPDQPVVAAVPLSQQTPPPHRQLLPGAGGGGGANNNKQQDCSNGNGCTAATSDNMRTTSHGSNGNGGSATTNKEDNIIVMKEKETPPQPVSMNDRIMDAGDDSDSMDEDEDDFDEDEDDAGGNNGNTMQYEIQFQRQSSAVVRPNASGGAGLAPARQPQVGRS